MKILFFTGVPVDDGATIYRSGVLACNLQKKGHQVIFTSVSRKFNKVERRKIGDLDVIFLGQAHYHAENKLSIRRKIGFAKVILENIKTSGRLAKIIIQEKPDRVLVIAAMPSSLIAGAVSRILGCWTAIDIEDYALGQMEASGYPKSLVKFYGFIERRLLKFFNQIIVCSEYLHKQYPDSKVVPNFVDCSFWNKKGRAGNGKHIYFVGQIGSYHGQLAVLEGLTDFLNQDKDLKLFFIGSGEMLENLKQKVRDLKLESQVILTGQITQEEIRELYLPGDIGILPLWNKPVHQARHPLKLIEYLAAGLVVVASRAGEATLIIQDSHNGFLCPEGDFNCIINKIKRVMTNGVLRKTISRNARITAKEFDLSQMVVRWSVPLSL